MDAARQAGLARNPKLLFWKNFAQYGMFLNPAWALFLLTRGLDGREVFLLGVVYAAATAFAELPTSWLGDRIGRRRGLLAGTLMLVAGAFLQIGAVGFVMFAVVTALRAAGDAFHSGTEEAVIVDSARELGHPEDVTHDAGVGVSGHHLAKALAPAVFAAGTLWLSGSALYAAMAWLTATAATLSFIPLAMIAEPRVGSITSVRQAIAPFRRHPILWVLTIHAGLRFTSVLIFFMAYPTRFAGLGLSGAWLGAFYALFHLGMVAHSRLAWKFDQRYGTARLVNGMSWACIPLGVAVAFIDVAWIAFVVGSAAFILSDARGIYYVRHVNDFIPPEARATTLSLMRMVQRLVEIPVLLLASWLAGMGTSHVLLLFAAMALLLVLFPFPSDARLAAAKPSLPPG